MKKITATKQSNFWMGEFGDSYSDRSSQDIEGMELTYRQAYGATRLSMNKAFVDKLPRSISILEVGANVGQQLEMLRLMGFTNLVGVEINDHAILQSHALFPHINIIKASAFDLPFRDRYFDMVFTSGVLIHIAPKDVKKAMDEIYRTSRSLIWGFEYYDTKHTMIPYRDRRNVMWKSDFAGMYLERFKDLKLVQQKMFPYVDDLTKKDAMFLLKK